ncbi:MAG TPA: NADH-quinone oxidoreductase subunit J [Thermodesulfobacteriota bacterium]|nr:NADH-quinone oxidoreductase subunit J [Deltaproteobacteria bacterium]HNR13648.1 NADH-quinone oxidoreductase subunit J [Thermodesulfobacteriota bacterium]
MEQALFYPLSAVILVTAVCIVCGRKPLYSSLWLLVLTGSLAGLYLLLGAELVAAMQMICASALALVILIFVLTAFRESHDGPKFSQQRWHVVTGIALSFLILAAAGFAFWGNIVPGSQAHQSLSSLVMQESGNTHAVGALLFRRYTFPMEVTAILLLTALIGAVTLVKKEHEGKG